MTGPNTALALMVRPFKPERGASHILLESLADDIFRGPAKMGHDIDLLVRDAQAQCLVQEKALAQIPDIAVPHLLEGPDGVVGLIVFDGALVDALIEQQTLGRISAAPRVDRPVTAIDAALSAGFATSAIAQLAQLCADRHDATALAGFTCASPQTDRAALSLAMSHKAYDVLCLTLDLGPGLKRGQVQLMFPAAIVRPKVRPKKTNPQMVAVLQDRPLRLQVELPSIKMPIRTLLGLEVGSVISLNEDALSSARLLDPRNKVLEKGRLGQLNGRRAIRVMREQKSIGQMELGVGQPAPVAEIGSDGMPIEMQFIDQNDKTTEPAEQSASELLETMAIEASA